MTKQKRRGSEQTELRYIINLELKIINRELKRKGFIWAGSCYTSAKVKSFREGFEDALRRQLSGETYVYVVRPEVLGPDAGRYHSGYHIYQFFKKEEK